MPNQEERRTRAYIISQLKVEELVSFERNWKEFLKEGSHYGKPYEIADKYNLWLEMKEKEKIETEPQHITRLRRELESMSEGY